MRTELLDYELPEELIARHPLSRRDEARLLVLQRDALLDRRVTDLVDLLPEGALVVLNETRVRRARLFCERVPSGGKAELLLLEALGPIQTTATFRALGRASKPLRPGTRLVTGELRIEVLEKDDEGTLTVRVDGKRHIEKALEDVGHVPIPPYLKRADEPEDAERYQTVFANRLGSVAAPTAGLHLSDELMGQLLARGVRFCRLTLHVGIGTFRPVTAEDLDLHSMHAEHMEVDERVVEAIAEARDDGRKVVAIGTTVVRALESAADPDRPGLVLPRRGATRLMIQPGYSFRVVDALMTNFHMPKSTLLALVGAFGGLDRILGAYRAAIARRYRFLSYGDAMFIPERMA